MLPAVSAALEKAQAHARSVGFDEANLLQARLAPDMFPLIRQVQVASSIAARGACRLAGAPVPSFADDETSFAALCALEMVDAQNDADLDAGAERELHVPTAGMVVAMRGVDYLQQFVLPNLYFRSATAYALLRHNGVVLGKRDFLGSLSARVAEPAAS